MAKAKKFHQKERPLSEEDKIRRRAIVFGILTLILGAILIFWGIPLFINLVEFLGEVKTENQQIPKEDIIPPPVPRLSYIPEATNSAQLEIDGVTEPGVTVKIDFNEEIIETMAEEEGKFGIEKLTLDKGKNSIVAWAADSAGNESEKTDKFEIVYETVAPELEIIKPEDGAAVEEQMVEVQGKTEPDARVEINEHVVIVGQEGKFAFTLTLQEGGNEIKVIAQDNAGNTTEKTLTITYLP